MKVHANAALGPAGRLALCEAVESGKSLRAAAAALNVAPATAHRWWHRRQAASGAELASGQWLCDRSSRPHRQPRRLAPAAEQAILRARRETGLGPGRLAGILRHARSTIWKVLRRHGHSRLRRSPRRSYRRYESSRPGALLHVDIAQLPRFAQPGHRVTSDRTRRTRGAGKIYLHACIDDCSRYAYVEQLADERAGTAAGFTRRAIEHFQALGLDAPEAVMSDNGNCYSSYVFRAELERARARQILTPPYTPRWNGRSSASSRRSSGSGPMHTHGPTQPADRARWHPSCVTTTGEGPTAR